MKCEVCLKLLEEYLDGELTEPEAAPVGAHLITCAACAHEFDSLSSEQEIYTRYDRELDVTPAMWSAIAARTDVGQVVDSESRVGWRQWFVVPSFGWSFAGAMAVLIFAVVMGVTYVRQTKPPAKQDLGAGVRQPVLIPERQPVANEKMTAIHPNQHEPVVDKKSDQSAAPAKSAIVARSPHSGKSVAADQSDVLFSDVAYSVMEEQDTQRHIEQAQNLLRSVRNINVTDDEEIDVSFEKALSRRLLNENIVLRRDAEMSGKFPTKMLLSDLEPFLIDIANLPDKPAPDDLRVIKERVLKTEIVAALLGH